jgi:hypothetical protein
MAGQAGACSLTFCSWKRGKKEEGKMKNEAKKGHPTGGACPVLRPDGPVKPGQAQSNPVSVIGLTVQDSYSKQALSQRLSPALADFLARVITSCFSQFSPEVEVSPLWQSFARVLVQDSTLQRLPPHLKKGWSCRRSS